MTEALVEGVHRFGSENSKSIRKDQVRFETEVLKHRLFCSSVLENTDYR